MTFIPKFLRRTTPNLPKVKPLKSMKFKRGREITITKDGENIGTINFDVKSAAVSLRPINGTFKMEGNTISFGKLSESEPTVKLEIK